jgi:hypothetical protein
MHTHFLALSTYHYESDKDPYRAANRERSVSTLRRNRCAISNKGSDKPMTDTKARQQNQSYQSPKRSTQTTAILQPTAAPDRHSRKCIICQHEDREEIEQAYVHWLSISDIKYDFELPSYSSIRRHAIATGLVELRRRTMRSALERIIERASDTKPTADAVIRAVRAYCALDNDNGWVDPPRRVVISHERTPLESALAKFTTGPSLPLAPPQTATPPPPTLLPDSQEGDKF